MQAKGDGLKVLGVEIVSSYKIISGNHWNSYRHALASLFMTSKRIVWRHFGPRLDRILAGHG